MVFPDIYAHRRVDLLKIYVYEEMRIIMRRLVTSPKGVVDLWITNIHMKPLKNVVPIRNLRSKNLANSIF